MSTPATNSAATVERDPVCGMNVNPATARHLYQHNGKNFYFCCAGCVEKFKADPAKYLEAKPKPSGLVTLGSAPIASPPRPHAEAPQPSATAYVCPMCPEVRETKPV